MQRVRVCTVRSGSPQRLGRRSVLRVGCWVQVVGVGSSTAWLQGGWQEAKPCSPPLPSHAAASCCCPLFSKPKCFLISLLHFPEPFPGCWRPRAWRSAPLLPAVPSAPSGFRLPRAHTPGVLPLALPGSVLQCCTEAYYWGRDRISCQL